MNKKDETSQERHERTYEPRKDRYRPRKNNRNPGPLQEFFSTVLYVAIAFLIFLVIRQFLFAPVSVEGESMYPTLADQDRLILNKVEEVDRFEVIVFEAPDDPGKQYIKRVIGLPGDEIRVEDDILYINGEPVEEPYLEDILASLGEEEFYTEDFSLSSLFGVETVPENSYFVLGDNRVNSKDSRSFGFVDVESVTGTTDIRIWPVDHFGDIDE